MSRITKFLATLISLNNNINVILGSSITQLNGFHIKEIVRIPENDGFLKAINKKIQNSGFSVYCEQQENLKILQTTKFEKLY